MPKTFFCFFSTSILQLIKINHLYQLHAPTPTPNLLLRKFNTENFNEKLTTCLTTLEKMYLLKK
jgi:hypothetical protein